MEKDEREAQCNPFHSAPQQTNQPKLRIQEGNQGYKICFHSVRDVFSPFTDFSDLVLCFCRCKGDIILYYVGSTSRGGDQYLPLSSIIPWNNHQTELRDNKGIISYVGEGSKNVFRT